MCIRDRGYIDPNNPPTSPGVHGRAPLVTHYYSITSIRVLNLGTALGRKKTEGQRALTSDNPPSCQSVMRTGLDCSIKNPSLETCLEQYPQKGSTDIENMEIKTGGPLDLGFAKARSDQRGSAGPLRYEKVTCRSIPSRLRYRS